MLPTQSQQSRQRMPTERGAHVLIVEDEASLSDSIRYNLEREGFTAAVAADGVRALERFRSEPFAIVILDLMLPELSGLDVCRAIRAESDVPIIMVTAKDSEADKVALKEQLRQIVSVDRDNVLVVSDMLPVHRKLRQVLDEVQKKPDVCDEIRRRLKEVQGPNADR